MSKLTQWLTILLPLSFAWTAVTYNILEKGGFPSISKQTITNQLIITSPFIFLITFGVYSAVVVLWRTFTFNDCPEAAAELQEEIKEAKQFLASKGIIDSAE